MDYSKGKIYQICNNINDKIYIGSTCQQLNRRMGDHRSRCKQSKYANILLYKTMCEIGSEHFFIELVEEFSCESKRQLHEREGYWINEKTSSNIGEVLNHVIPTRNRKTYYNENKEHILEKNHARYKIKRETILQKKKEYYTAHKQEILQKKETYRDNKREELHIKYKEFYNKNKERLLARKKELYHEHKETLNKHKV